jgi:hypothetical protein
VAFTGPLGSARTHPLLIFLDCVLLQAGVFAQVNLPTMSQFSFGTTVRRFFCRGPVMQFKDNWHWGSLEGFYFKKNIDWL